MKQNTIIVVATLLLGCARVETPPSESLSPVADEPASMPWTDEFVPEMPKVRFEYPEAGGEFSDMCLGLCTARARLCPLRDLEEVAARPGVVQRFGDEAFVLRPVLPFAEPHGDSEDFATPEIYSDGLLRVSLTAFPLSRGGGGTGVDRGVGYVDRNGRLVIPPVFVEAETFSEGLAAVRIDVTGPVGYIDTSGEMVIPPRFEEAGFFSEGLAAASQQGEWGYIDRSGTWVIEPQFEYVGVFSAGFAPVFVGEFETARVDRTGTVSRRRDWMGGYVSGHDDPAFWWPPAIKRAFARGISEGRRVQGDQCSFAVTDSAGRLVFDEVVFESFWIAATARRQLPVRVRTRTPLERTIKRPGLQTRAIGLSGALSRREKR